ncbi:hypothetical protein Aca07nite_84280 [Actinoplanes capillaceus]|uniref:Uncharacterized protein n=1 Tax=Actinoplanes campanulatus TaxID=113559 RepID=A0ABQ3WYD9_9ACTN|nr:hypothetical protein Aca07nite_84280 [Actinoplanes capillaceus]
MTEIDKIAWIHLVDGRVLSTRSPTAALPARLRFRRWAHTIAGLCATTAPTGPVVAHGRRFVCSHPHHDRAPMRENPPDAGQPAPGIRCRRRTTRRMKSR